MSDREALRGDAGERQIDRFIEHRSRQFGAEEATEHARSLRAAEHERRLDRGEVVRELWRRHHRRLAATHVALAAEHERRAERLAGAGEGVR